MYAPEVLDFGTSVAVTWNTAENNNCKITVTGWLEKVIGDFTRNHQRRSSVVSHAGPVHTLVQVGIAGDKETQLIFKSRNQQS